MRPSENCRAKDVPTFLARFGSVGCGAFGKSRLKASCQLFQMALPPSPPQLKFSDTVLGSAQVGSESHRKWSLRVCSALADARPDPVRCEINHSIAIAGHALATRLF